MGRQLDLCWTDSSSLLLSFAEERESGRQAAGGSDLFTMLIFRQARLHDI